MASVVSKLRQQPAWIALIIFALLCLWLLSGMSSNAQAPTANASKSGAPPIAEVRTRLFKAENVNREVVLYGRTEPDRLASVRAEVEGKIAEVLVAEGEAVKSGQPLLKIEENDIRQQLVAAKSHLEQRNLELKGARSLGQKGYQSEVALAQAKSAVDEAEARIEQLQLRLQKTVIRAPFDGVMNKRHVELGDYVREADMLATVVDLDPLIISANVSEQHIDKISLEQRALGRMLSGQQVSGSVRYISQVSNPGTNTFPIEVAVANPDSTLRAGISTEVILPLKETLAIKITPAAMALDQQGNLGVKAVEQNVVRFVPIDIVKSDAEGVWLSGLGEQAQIITLGHGYVNHGDKVNAVMVDSEL